MMTGKVGGVVVLNCRTCTRACKQHKPLHEEIELAPNSGRLWSLMTSMMRLPASLRGEKDTESRDLDQDKENAVSVSLIRRCASIAGSLVRPSGKESSSMEDNQSLKRKRTQTLDNQYCSPMSPSSSSKRYRIRPREPIERMRRH